MESYRTLTDDEAAVLADPGGWRMASTLLGREIPLHRSSRYARWAREHAHTHSNEIEIFVTLNGTMPFGYGGRNYALSRGDVVIANRDEQHVYPYPPFSPDCDHLILNLIHGSALYRLYSMRGGQEKGRSPSCEVTGSSDLVRQLQDSLDSGAHTPALPSTALRTKIVALVSLLLLKVLETDLREAPSAHDGSQRSLMNAMRDHIMSTGGKNITLDHLSHLAGYSKYHFHRLFREQTGMTVHACINQARTEKVRELFSSGALNKQVGIELGFSSPAAFSRWLRAARERGLV